MDRRRVEIRVLALTSWGPAEQVTISDLPGNRWFLTLAPLMVRPNMVPLLPLTPTVRHNRLLIFQGTSSNCPSTTPPQRVCQPHLMYRGDVFEAPGSM